MKISLPPRWCKPFFVAFVFLLFANSSVFAQLQNVTGTVSTSDNKPLAGVSVQRKGAGTGTVTDTTGQYNIRASKGAILVFSFIGYIEKEVLVTGNSSVDVTLEPTVSNMDQVVVVAYGSQKKITVTGAVSTVSTEQLRQSSSASLANALAGRLAGLTSIQSGGGQPGRDDATLYLRGAATTNGTGPLILIDGVPRDNIRTLDPNEVATVSVLKDASSTAVFGVRGANGVILITTKRGVAGRTKLNVNVDQSYTQFTREPERLHSVDYMKLRNEALLNDGSAIAFTDADIAKYANPLDGLDPNAPDYAQQKAVREYMYPDHDYYREFIDKYTPQTRVNVSASGGTDKLTYFVNGVYLHQGGNLNTEPESQLGYDPSLWMDRYNFRANLDYKISSSFKAFLNIGSYIEKVNMPSAGLYPGSDTHWMITDLIYQAQTVTPITVGPTTIDGFGVAPGQIVDPGYLDRSAFEIMNRMGYRNEVRSNLNSSLGFDWDLGKSVTPGLSVRTMISYDSKSTTAMQGYKSERLYLAIVNPETNALSYSEKRSGESLLSLVKGADSRYNINMQAAINYKRSFGKHDIGGMILGQRDYWETPAGEIPYNVLGVAGRFMYAYDDRYFAEVNLGYNGSEQFAPSNRFGFFPAVSAGWVVSNEKFFKVKPITNLKFRASYGKVGNDQIGGARFLYQDNITLGGGPLPSLGLGQGVNQGLLGNPNITWEIAEKANYGVDLGLYKELTVSFDYYNEKRTDILISRGTVPEFQGVPLGNIPKVNMGRVDNHGYEVEVTYNHAFSKAFSVNVRGNYGYNHNTVKFIDEAKRDDTYKYQYTGTGFSLGQSWGYKIDYSNGNGYFNSQKELDDYLAKTTYSFGTPRVGYFIYQDLNGDGVVDDKDLAPIKYTNIPSITYGLNLGATYKGFDVTVFFQGVGKYSSNYANQGVYENIKQGTYFGYHKTAWTAERYAAGDKITYPALSTTNNTNQKANDFFIMDRSFIRLKNLEIAYTLPKGTLKALGVQDCRFYIGAQNLITWDHLRMNHLDPEQNESIGYPITGTKNIGVNITF